MEAVFIHIPKNAGTSVVGLLRASDTDCIIKRHGSASFVMDEIGEAEFRSRFSFAFVRNPWDRMVSIFYFQKSWTRKHGKWPIDPNELNEDTPLKFYQEDDFLGFIPWFLDRSHTSLTVHNHIPNQEQLAWLTNKEDTDIIVDFVGKVENIAEDMAIVQKILGIKEKLPHRNKTIRKPEYRKYYDDETAELIADVFSRDIEVFEYEF